MAAPARRTGHRAPERRNWASEHAELVARDRREPLDPPGLERLGNLAFLLGRETESTDIYTRAHNLALERGNARQAARCAVWISFAMLGQRELTRAGGWAARAKRLLDESGEQCAECGYVLLPVAVQHGASGDFVNGESTFAAAERIGERFGDRDLTSLARQGRGRMLVALGRVAEGL